MKKLYLVLVLFALVSCIFAAGTSSVSSSTNSIGTFFISNQSLYSPYPVEPGKYVDLWLRIQYRGETKTVDGVVCMIEPKFPFSFDVGESAEKQIGTIASYDEVVLKYKLRVSENAVQGANTIIFKCKSSSSDWIGNELSFYIQTHEAILSVEKVESLPEVFGPNEKGKVNIYLKNLAENTMKDISVKLDLSGSDIPFAPVGSTIEKRISELNSNSQAIISFDVISMKDATAKTYKVPITFTYSDDLGRNYSKNSIIALTIQTKKPELLVISEQSGYIKSGVKNSVTISFINQGDAQIKYLVTELQYGSGFQIISPREVYVGSINSDDSQTASFDLFINTTDNRVQLPLTVKYSDIDGNEYSTSTSVDVNVFTKEAAVSYGLEKVVSSDPLIFALGAIIVIYILYRLIKFVFVKKKKTSS